jgi:hypothetical protein
MDENGIDRVTLFSFSPYDNPDYYRIKHSRLNRIDPQSLPSGVYVISAHILNRLKEKGLDFLSRYPVMGHLGYSMYVFRIP